MNVGLSAGRTRGCGVVLRGGDSAIHGTDCRDGGRDGRGAVGDGLPVRIGGRGWGEGGWVVSSGVGAMPGGVIGPDSVSESAGHVCGVIDGG